MGKFSTCAVVALSHRSITIARKHRGRATTLAMLFSFAITPVSRGDRGIER